MALAQSKEPLAPATTQEGPLSALPYTPSLDPAFIDRTVNPCTDFYRYACGNWIKNNPIPADQARWDVYAKLTDENQRFLWGILQQEAKSEASRTPAEQKIGDFFAACMDESAIASAGLRPLAPGLSAIAGLKSVSELPALVARLQLLHNLGGAPFGFRPRQDLKNSDRVIAFIAAGGLGLPDRDYYVKTDAKSQETRAKYVAHLAAMFKLLGDEGAKAQSEAGTVMAIETGLAKASLTRVQKRDPYNLFHMFTPEQLTALTPDFQWKPYLSALGMPPLSEFNVTEPEFLKEFDGEIKSHPVEDWKAYLRWHLIHANAPLLSPAVETENFDFYSRYLRGVTQMPPRWKRCVRSVDRELGDALGEVFVAKTFGPEVKARAVAMTKGIEAAMAADIQQLTWMSPETKEQATGKLHTIVNKIGYPAKWRDYSSVRIVRGDYLGDVTRASTFETRRQLSKIGKPVDRGEWGMTPPTVNAYYNPQMNDINFPAGVLQPPLFDAKLDDAPNYGNTGATIGHELTHGFDDQGRQFDAKGNLRDWWTKADAEEFKKRASCISDQYSSYNIIDEIKINGKLTLGEDVADLGGTLLAYIAWQGATKGMDLKPVDGLTPAQRFFVGMAQWACGDERPAEKRLSAITDPHSPGEYRINGVVSNMPQFAEAFACKTGQPMVRASACRVW